MKGNDNYIIKSKTFIFIYFFGIIAHLFIFFWLLIFIISVVFGEGFKIYNLFNIPFLIIPGLMLYVFSNFIKSFLIKEENITIKYFFINIKPYQLNFFDYCFTTIERGKGGVSEALYLVKDKKLKIRISSGIYKNYFQLKDVLIKKIDYKGMLDLDFSESLNGFLGNTINKLP